MRCQIFKAMGEREIDGLDTKINIWIGDELDKDGRQIKHTNTAFGEVRNYNGGANEPCLIVTIWFDHD